MPLAPGRGVGGGGPGPHIAPRRAQPSEQAAHPGLRMGFVQRVPDAASRSQFEARQHHRPVRQAGDDAAAAARPPECRRWCRPPAPDRRAARPPRPRPARPAAPPGARPGSSAPARPASAGQARGDDVQEFQRLRPMRGVGRVGRVRQPRRRDRSPPAPPRPSAPASSAASRQARSAVRGAPSAPSIARISRRQRRQPLRRLDRGRQVERAGQRQRRLVQRAERGDPRQQQRPAVRARAGTPRPAPGRRAASAAGSARARPRADRPPQRRSHSAAMASRNGTPAGMVNRFSASSPVRRGRLQDRLGLGQIGRRREMEPEPVMHHRAQPPGGHGAVPGEVHAERARRACRRAARAR